MYGVGLLCALTALADAAAQDDQGRTEQLFAVVDDFDPLDSSALPFVRQQLADGADRLGFVVGDRGGTLRVRWLDFTASDCAPATVSAADPGAVARELAARLQRRQQEPLSWQFTARPGQLMPPLAQGLLLARACARRGLKQDADRLLQAMPPVDEVRSELADGCYDWLLVAHADPARTRAELAALHHAWLRAFGDDWRAGRVDKAAAALAATAPPPVPAGDTATRAAALVAALVEQFTPLADEPQCTALAPRAQPDTSPGAALVGLGLGAAPALVAALDDERPSRCVLYCACGDSTDCGFRVLPVQRLAFDALRAVSGLQFAARKPAQEVQLARQWWAAVAQGGEAAGLLWAMRRGGADSGAAAARLLQRFPQQLDAALAALRASASSRGRCAMLAAIAAVEAPAVLEFLRQELQAAPFVSERVAAGRALLRRGEREAVPLFGAVWRALGGDASAAVDRDLLMLHDDERDEIAALLLASGDAAAVALVADGLPQRPPATRAGVAGVLLRTPLSELLELAPPAAQPVVAAAIEDLLQALLGDGHRSARAPLRVPGGGVRNADLAAAALAALWPLRYRFDAGLPTRQRDRQIAAAAAAWRQLRGLPPLVGEQPGDGAVRLELGALTPSAGMQAAVAAVRQPAAGSAAVLQLLLASASLLGEGRGSVRVEVDRADAGRFVLVQVEPRPGESIGGASLVFDLRAGGNVLHEGSDGGMRDSFAAVDDFAALRPAIDRALAAAGPFAIVLVLDWD